MLMSFHVFIGHLDSLYCGMLVQLLFHVSVGLSFS